MGCTTDREFTCTVLGEVQVSPCPEGCYSIGYNENYIISITAVNEIDHRISMTIDLIVGSLDRHSTLPGC